LIFELTKRIINFRNIFFHAMKMNAIDFFKIIRDNSFYYLISYIKKIKILPN